MNHVIIEKNDTVRRSAKPRVIIRSLDGVTRENLEWLWPSRIPLGKVTVLAGDPGLGKSFVTLDIAARVSRGDTWPDDHECEQAPGGVVLLNAEDDLCDTVAPRLDNAGADDRNVFWIDGVASRIDECRFFSLHRDVERLDDVLAGHPHIRLVVIDPISAYCDGIDTHRNSDVRGLLAPLVALACRHRVAVVAVNHLNKSPGKKAVYRAMGSLAFVAAARAAWGIVKDGEDHERRILVPIKLNLARDPFGLAYRIVDGRVQWEPAPVYLDADEALAAELSTSKHPKTDTVLHSAMAWLRTFLAADAQIASVVFERGIGAGFTERTIQRAFAKLGGVSKKLAFHGGWLWALPEDA